MRKLSCPHSTELLAPVALAFLTLALTLLGFGLLAEEARVAQADPGVTIAIDVDPTGNTIDTPIDSDSDTTLDTEQTSLGTIDECVSIASPGTIEIDIVVQGYPSTDPLKSYLFTLYYDSSALEVKSVLTGDAPETGRTLLSADPQSGPFFPFSMGDFDGAFLTSVVDRAPLDPDEDVDGAESSDGFLARLTLDVLAEGVTPLTLGSNSSVGGDEGQIPVAKIQGAQIAVGGPCPGTPTPAPSPSPTVAASPAPTLTPSPEATTVVTATPAPTLTPTPAPTLTPAPTPTPAPTLTPTPSSTSAPTVETTPVPTKPKLTPSLTPSVSPQATATAAPAETGEPASPPPTGVAGDSGTGSGPPWLAIGLGLGIAAGLAGGAIVAARRWAR